MTIFSDLQIEKFAEALIVAASKENHVAVALVTRWAAAHTREEKIIIMQEFYQSIAQIIKVMEGTARAFEQLGQDIVDSFARAFDR